jgi:hypothetical protein
VEEVPMRSLVQAVVLVATVIIASTALIWAAIIPYSQDFEGLVQSDPNALAGDGWLFYVTVYDDLGGWQNGYGGPAPNGPQICAIATGQGGPSQGAQQLSVYSNYDDASHGNTDWVIESNVFQEQTIEAADVGATVVFTFDAKLGNLELSSEAEGFIKTLDPDNGYATTNHVTVDMTAIPATWGTYSIELLIDSGLVGQILQFGFTSRASNYEGSGVFYDNVNQPVPVEMMTITVE